MNQPTHKGSSQPQPVSVDSPSIGVVQSAGIMSAAVLLSRVTGLGREMFLARLFGAGMEFEAYRLGFLIPNLARDLFAEGALSSAFVPTFTETLATKGKQAAARLSNLVTTAVILVVGGICLLGVVFAPQLVGLFPGFQLVPGKTELAVHLTRIMFPFLLLVALAAQVMGVLNSCNQFGIPALASSFFNITSVVFGFVFGFWAGPWIGMMPIEGMAWGVVLGGALQFACQLPSYYEKGFSFRLAWDPSHPGLRHIIRLMGPAILGGAAVQINVMMNTSFATYLQDPVRGANGPVSWLTWAFRFMQLPIGLFGVALASATLPSITRSFVSGNQDEFRRTLSRSLAVVFLLTVPSSIGLVVLGRQMISAIYEGGKFDAYDTQQTALALSCYAVGLAGYAGVKILNPAFYALKDSRTPMMISMASVLINFVAASAMLRWASFGHSTLALTTSTVALFNFIALFWILRNRIGGVYGRDLASSTGRVALAAVGMGVLTAMLQLGVEAWLGQSRLSSIVALAVCIPAGVSVFYGACRLLQVPELELAVSGVVAPFRRYLGRRSA